MKAKQITPAELALETGKFLKQAERGPVIVRSGRGRAILIRAMSEEDLVDELITSDPKFRASIRKARRDRRDGKFVSLAEARRILGA